MSLHAPFSLDSAAWLSPTEQLGLPGKPGAPRRAQKLSTAQGCPENSSQRYFSPCFCLLPLLTLSLWSKSTELETEVRRS